MIALKLNCQKFNHNQMFVADFIHSKTTLAENLILNFIQPFEEL